MDIDKVLEIFKDAINYSEDGSNRDKTWCLGSDGVEAIRTMINYITSESKGLFIHTGDKVRNINSGVVGVVLRETESGSVQVLEKINPIVICTHDNWNTLEFIERV